MSDMLSESEIGALVRDIRNEPHFKERNTEWDGNRRLVFRERPVVIPGISMETEWRTPDLLDAADKYTARFLGAPFTVNVSAQGPGPQAEKKAQAMENYDYRLLSRWWANDCFTGAIHDMAGVTGEGWVHLTLNREILPIIPVQDDGEDDEAYLARAKPVLDEFTQGEKVDLFQIEPVNEPETIYYNADRSLIFSWADVPLAPLQAQYSREGAGGLLGKPGKGKSISESDGKFTIRTIAGSVNPEGTNAYLYGKTVKLYIVETADYIYHLIEDLGGEKVQALGCYKNVFGAPGFVWVHARKTNHPSSKHAVHPLTHAAIAIAPTYNIMGTIVYSGGILGEFMRFTLEELPGAEAAQSRAGNKNLEIEMIGQRAYKGPDGYKIVQQNLGVSPDTVKSFADLEAKMLRSGYDPALNPDAQMQASSGYQQAIVRDLAADTLDPPLTNIASMLSQILRLKDTGVKTLGIPITFRNFAPTAELGKVARSVMDEITINPDDIVDVDRSVSFDSLTQYARQAKIELGRELLGEGRITEDMFLREYMGVDDPLRLKKQRLVEKAQTIAEEAALKAAGALFQRITEPVGQEAMAQTGVLPFAQNAQDTPDAQAGVYVGNGADGAVPVAPAPPNPQAEMAMAGGAPGVTA